MKKYTYFLLFGLLSIISCKEELITIPEFELPVSERIVLIEELTGVSCPNCPTGTATIEQIKANYGKRVVAVAIHGQFLSNPTPESKYDFRNPYAKELESYLKPWQGKPAASVNRIKFTDDELSVSTPSLWSNFIDIELKREHVINIELLTSYNSETRQVDITATIIPLKDFTEADNLHFSLMVLESEIEDAQEDSNTIIEEYEHNHVLRDMITDTKGNPIAGNLESGKAFNLTYSYTIPLPEEGQLLWIPEHMEIVGFVNQVSGDTKDVLQAAEAKVIQ